MNVDIFLQELDYQGFAGCYDFAYMPVDFRMQTTLGYGFVNLVSVELAHRARRHFDGFERWEFAECDSKCLTIWSDKEQGVDANVERYRNSPVMHLSVSDEYKPRLFDGGQRVEFPAPRVNIKAPKLRKSKRS